MTKPGKIVDFLAEIDKLKAVKRYTYTSGGGRAWKEQDVTLEMLMEKSRNYGCGREDSMDVVWEEFFRIAKEKGMFSGNE